MFGTFSFTYVRLSFILGLFYVTIHLSQATVESIMRDKMPKKGGRWWFSWRGRNSTIKEVSLRSKQFPSGCSGKGICIFIPQNFTSESNLVFSLAEDIHIKHGLKSDLFWLQKALDQTLPEMFAWRVLILHLVSLHKSEAVVSNVVNLCLVT